jgi:hypothetical protein
MDSTSFQVRLTDSALNDLHEIDDYSSWIWAKAESDSIKR